MTFQQQEHFHASSTGAFTSLNNAKKRKKVVTMKPTVIIHDIDATVSQEEKSELYYTKDDLVMTNLEIKAICALSKHLPQTPYDDTNNKDSKCWLAVEADGFLRGLEFHIYPLRFRNKLLARRALLKYQSHLAEKYPDITHEQKAKAMATASEKLSAWSHVVAKETARLDSLRAYDGDYMIPLDNLPMCVSPFPELTIKPKRKASFKEIRRVTDDNDTLPPLKKAKAA
jgi:hypothetical protein